MKLQALLREPLTHFFVIGLAIFAVYAYLDRGDNTGSAEIVVDQARVDTLRAQFMQTWQRPPTGDELQNLIDNWIREEILYREGIAMRLDEDDAVVRRRIAQKMDFITDSLMPDEPTEQELQAWLDQHPDLYRVPAEYSLSQIYFDPARHGDRLQQTIEAARSALEADGGDDVRGDSTLLPYHMGSAAANQIAQVFGEQFAATLASLPVGRWSGPVESAYGMHLVYLESSQPGRQPGLDEVRAAVQRDLMHSRSQLANQAYYEALREKYNVRVASELRLSTDAAGR